MSNGDKVKEFYSNDIIYRFDKRKRIIFGVVIDSYEASSDVDEFHSLQKGQIEVLWNNNFRKQIWRQSKVRLLSRSIIPGDIVRRLEKGVETQRGYCKESKQYATIQIVGTDKVVEHVCSQRLHPIRPFNIDDAVCLGTKFGRIENIEQLVTLQSECGSIVELMMNCDNDIEDYWLSKRNRTLVEAYPGQEVIGTPKYFEQAHWVKKSKQMKRNMQYRQRFTVQNVVECQIEVAWCGNGGNSSYIAEVKPEDIKKLKVLEHPGNTCLELAERRLLKLNSSDVLVPKKDWVRKQSLAFRPDQSKTRPAVNCTAKSVSRISKLRVNTSLYSCIEQPEPEDEWWTEESDDDNASSASGTKQTHKRHYPPKPRDLIPGNTLGIEILCIESKATIVWQDGTEERDIPTTQLYFSMSLDDHEFFPGEWVVQGDEDEAEQCGAIQNVNYLERTASVKWFTYSDEEKKPIELSTSLNMSVYDLKKYSKFVFRPGSVVKSIPEQDDRMGYVIDSCPQGHIQVQWLDGPEENCWPQHIEVIPDNVDYDCSTEDDTEGEEQVSWETESIESYAGDLTDETTLQNMAARLDFVRNRIVYLKEVFREHNLKENLTVLKDLLLIYDNSSYLDKLLGTLYFSLKSKHFQALLQQAKEKAKSVGIELRGRLFCNDNLCPSSTKLKVAERENINKMIKLENKINAQLETCKEETKSSTDPTTPVTPDSIEIPVISEENLCIELLSMLKIRMDLAYAEIMSRIGGNEALTVLTKASETIATPVSSTPLPSIPSTPDDSFSQLSPPKLVKSISNIENEPYSIIDDALPVHHYYYTKFEPNDYQRFLKAIQKEYKLLKDLPPGVWVRSFSNRTDLLSVMIRGPANTPYEDGLFLFDMQLSQDYPRSPPSVHYISYSSERLNPNLYVEGRVCVSLLGTWMGRGTEVWGPNSTLLQLIVSIQGLILVSEPYYNEAGYEKQTDTQQGYENSRTYNELVILKLVQSMTELLKSPSSVFKQEILSHFALNGQKLCQRLQKYCSDVDPLKPEFPLLPVSKGLKLSLTAALSSFQQVLKSVIGDNASNTEIVNNDC